MYNFSFIGGDCVFGARDLLWFTFEFAAKRAFLLFFFKKLNR